jgi:hypothetical protein
MLDVPDVALPVVAADDFWTVLCVGCVLDHPQLFSDDLTGETLAAHVNRLAAVLRRAPLLATAGGEGAAVH